MNPFRWTFGRIAAACWAAAAVAAHAQSVPPADGAPAANPYRAAFESAWQRSLQRRESAALSGRARAEQQGASSWTPEAAALEVNTLDDRWHNNTGRKEAEIGVVVPVWWPGQRSARAAVAEAELQLAEASTHAARLRLAAQVIDAGWSCSAAVADQQVADSRHRFLAELGNDVERRVKAGDLAPADALAARADALEARSLADEAARRTQASESTWTLLTGVPTCPIGPESSPPPGTVGAFDVSSHPEAVRAQVALEAARRRLEVVQASRRDPPEVSVRYRQESSGSSEATQRGIGIGLRVPFGTDARSKPVEAAALGDLNQAELALERVRERLVADERMARSTLEGASVQLDHARARAQASRERSRLLDKAFKAGEASLPDVLRAAQSAALADAQLARLTSALGQALAKHHIALGILP
ncbi:TolC family protein [Rhizobacter sp. Root1221]|uniref:TolC family protein n=1 Tax=Rhizobacter sp. Root1221 TaxID=1736433 RepID=UPI0006F3EE93|nr:TolC family protein [Rhizobacter sp. Root1221]KQW02913.1 hypothetical protein ASC87_00750 [Rhizobacter sp. Root1221]